MARRLPPLKKGDAVRIIAPSSPFDRASFDAGLAIIGEAGLEARVDDGLFSKRKYLAGDDDRRLAELLGALAEPDTRAIWLARGGYGATRLLKRLDLAAIAASDKWLVGFSDCTALHAAWQRAGLCSLHGANVTTLPTWSDAARAQQWAALFEDGSITAAGRTHRGSGRITAPLVGGNLAVLASMAGTGHLPSWEGAIVLLEDVGERPYRLDRYLTQLTDAGQMNGVAAVVVGQLLGCEEPPDRNEDFDAIGVMLENLETLEVPLAYGFEIGHAASSGPVVLGVDATLDLETGELRSRA